VRSDARAEYEARKARLHQQYAAAPVGTPVRLAKTPSLDRAPLRDDPA